MKNTDNNQNNEVVERMSFLDFLIELPIKFLFLAMFLLWLFGMGLTLVIVKFSK